VTVSEALREATARLQVAGVPDPPWDAELLLRHVTGFDRASLLASGHAPLTEVDRQRYGGLIEQRALRRPLQHLIGRQHFWGHEFRVSPDVLIPRSETELLVEAALAAIERLPHPIVVDVGTGSGCIALSIAGDRPDASVHAGDISGSALEVAAQNARDLGLDGRVDLRRGDLLEPFPELRGKADLVVSNPPYVDPSEWSSLMPEVREHEPRSALLPVGGGDRYSVYRRLVPQARELLRPEGTLMVEIGRGMDVEVVRLCQGEGFRVEQVVPDLQDIPRVVVARLPA
jgi:release factor glutamine methyltransferase